MRNMIATRVNAQGVSRPAWMDAPPRVRASTIAAREKEREHITCLLTKKREQT
jgi:cytidylate kinase